MNIQTRKYVEDAVKIDLTGLIKSGFIKGGREGKSTGSLNGQYLWSIGWYVSNNTDKLVVYYTCQNKEYRHTINVHHQSVHFGGCRMYLICEVCGHTRKQLYIVSHSVGCRKCQCLHYKTQSKAPTERDLDRYLRLSHKVDYFGFGIYLKRKHQHWKTFSKVNKQMDSIHSKHPSIFN